MDTRARAGASDELLHDCTRSQLMHVPVRQRQAAVVEMIKLDDDVAVAGTAVVKLDDSTVALGRCFRISMWRPAPGWWCGCPPGLLGEERPPPNSRRPGFEAEVPKVGCWPVDRYLKPLGYLDLRCVTFRFDEGRFANEARSAPSCRVGPGACRDGARRVIWHNRKPESGSCTASLAAGQQRGVVVQDPAVGRLAVRKISSPGLDPVQHERCDEVAVLQSRNPCGVVREQALAHAERRQHDHHVLHAASRPVQAPDRSEACLELLEGLHAAPCRSAPFSSLVETDGEPP